MELTEQEKKDILDSLLTTISHIGDKGYQKRVWIQGAGPECDDFGETVNFFFEEGAAILETYKEFNISEAQYKLLKKFYDEFEKFADENDLPGVFIDDPEWEKIMAKAKEILKAFNYEKTSNK